MPAYFQNDDERDAFLAEPRLAMLLTNRASGTPIGVPVWVAFDGIAQIKEGGGAELVARMGPRYWDLSEPKLQETLDQWIQAEVAMVRIVIEPDRIRAGA